MSDPKEPITSGVPELDAVLGGGWPIGEIPVIHGVICGKSKLNLAGEQEMNETVIYLVIGTAMTPSGLASWRVKAFESEMTAQECADSCNMEYLEVREALDIIRGEAEEEQKQMRDEWQHPYAYIDDSIRSLMDGRFRTRFGYIPAAWSPTQDKVSGYIYNISLRYSVHSLVFVHEE